MTRIRFALLPVALLVLVGCNRQEKPTAAPPTPGNTGGTSGTGGTGGPTDNSGSLAEARKGFATKLARKTKANEPLDEPPPKVFRKAQFDSAVGKLAAYLSPDPKDGKKHPAIVWITGGDCNTIGDVW